MQFNTYWVLCWRNTCEGSTQRFLCRGQMWRRMCCPRPLSEAEKGSLQEVRRAHVKAPWKREAALKGTRGAGHWGRGSSPWRGVGWSGAHNGKPVAGVRKLGCNLKAKPRYGSFLNRSDRNPFTLLCPQAQLAVLSHHGDRPFSDHSPEHSCRTDQCYCSCQEALEGCWARLKNQLSLTRCVILDIVVLTYSSLIGPPNGLLIKSVLWYFKNFPLLPYEFQLNIFNHWP